MLAVSGWVTAGALGLLVLRLRRRLDLVGDAGHELRGPVAAFAFAVAWLRREPGGVRRALRFEAELERMRAALDDLDAARLGRRAPARPRTVALERLVDGAAAGWSAAVTGRDRGVRVRWDAGRVQVRADRRRLSQAFGNLLANAAEHGSGPIEVRAVRQGPCAVRVEVRDGGPAVRTGRHGATRADRGRGLGIAGRAIREAGGTLELRHGRRGTVAAVELPLAESSRAASQPQPARARKPSPGGETASSRPASSRPEHARREVTR
jgi:C4-dicarboxylate-specific signal transduction histidine kinase